MWTVTSLQRARKHVLLSVVLAQFLAGCAAPDSVPFAPAELAAEAPAASVDSETATNSQISWNPTACNFPVGSGTDSLEITHVEVTQGVQTPENELPLVAGRSTAVLAHINAVTSATGTLTGTMRVTDANGQTVAILNPTAQLLADGPSSGRAYVVLVFEPFSISDLQQVTVNVEVQANIDGNSVFATAGVEDIPVLKTAQPSLYFSLIDFWPRRWLLDVEASANPYPQFIDLAASPYGDALMRGAIPVDDGPAWFYEHFQDMEWGGWIDNLEASITPADSCGLFERLSTMRETIVTSFIRPNEEAPISVGSIETKFLYGWVYAPTCAEEHSNVVQENGNALMGGRVAYGSTTPCKGQHTFVHETLHNLYVEHDSDPPLDVCGWDVGLHLKPGQWSPEAAIEQRKSLQFSRIMGHNSTDISWAALEEYKEAMAYLGSPKLVAFTQTLPDCSTGAKPCIEQGQYVFQGCLANEGFPAPQWNTHQIPWYSQPTPYTIADSKHLPYRLVFRSQGRDFAEVPFDARMATNPDDGSEGVVDLGFFNVVVPESLVLEADEIVIRGEGIDEIPFRNRTEPPEIYALEIRDNDGEGRLSVYVSAGDFDSELTCQFSFSPDEGQNWFPLKPTYDRPKEVLDREWVTLAAPCGSGADPNIELQETLLPEEFSSDSRLLRVAVSDGFNIITQDIDY